LRQNRNLGYQRQDNTNNRGGRCLEARERRAILSREEQRVVKRS
jgi:hypothetical protein